jgi:RIO kinase 1
VVDIVANPNGMDFLMRDCHNVCSWFTSRGLVADEHDLFGELVAAAF